MVILSLRHLGFVLWVMGRGEKHRDGPSAEETIAHTMIIMVMTALTGRPWVTWSGDGGRPGHAGDGAGAHGTPRLLAQEPQPRPCTGRHYCPLLLMMHSFCMHHQGTWDTSLAAIDGMIWALRLVILLSIDAKGVLVSLGRALILFLSF
jgi:hypothetical protein